MKVEKTCLAAAAVAALFVVSASLTAAGPAAHKVGAESVRHPVLVELFTAEGCSDCPPADNLLRIFASEQPIADAEIIPVEEHVDYWNHGGWMDPFSSASWTRRQEQYASAFKQKQVYSPEMVVDGQIGFPGANAQEAEQSIKQAAQRPETRISIAPGEGNAKHSKSYTITLGKLRGDAAGDRVDVWLGVTEEGLQDSVTGGENKGHVLYHSAVLRSLRKIGTVKSHPGSKAFRKNLEVQFNPHWKRKNLRVVVFLQEEKSLRILGAASAPVLE